MDHRLASFAFPRTSTAIAIFGILIALLSPDSADAADHYISTTGSDTTGDGSLGNPYRTIQKGADAAQPGDGVFVRGGTYRETVTVARSGTSSAPITFQPYSGERVTVTGLDVVDSDWSPDSGSIHCTTVSGGVSQLFVNGQMMVEARWPNTEYNNPLRAATSVIGSVSLETPALITITDSALAGTPNGTWTGATLAITSGLKWSTLARQIQSNTSNTLQHVLGSVEQESPAFFSPKAGNPYYIYGSLAALNSPKEWHYDSSTSRLYLHAPGNVNPRSQVIEARKRLVGFDLGSNSYVTVQGFSLKAATINVAGEHNTIDNCQILYPTPFTAQTEWKGASGVQISGRHNTIRHSEIGYSWGDGVTITESNNTVDNNIIHDVGWGGNEAAFVSTCRSPSNTITGNTMYNAGRNGVLVNSPVSSYGWTANTVVQHNDISRYGVLTDDLGGIYAFNTDSPGTTIAYNRIDGSGATSSTNAGVFLDDSSNRMTVHHNLVTNGAYGALIRGTDHDVYNNTFWNIGNKAVVSAGLYKDITVVNNLANVNHFSGNALSNNRYQTVHQFTNSAAGDFTLTANSAGSDQGSTYKRAVDYGTLIPGITDGYVGPAPDAGAFESGVTSWTAGSNWRTWLAGNQLTAPLLTSLSVAPGNERTKTGPLVAGNAGGVNRRAFLKFDLTNIRYTTIANATLRIYEVRPPDSAKGTVTLQRVAATWTDANVSYKQSLAAGTLSGFYDPANLDLYTDIDITAWVQGWLSNPAMNHGLRLSGTEGIAGTAKYFDGFYGVTAPQLVITLP